MNRSEDPTPAEQDDSSSWKRAVAATEINARRVNEAIERGESGPEPSFVCECGHLGCSQTVRLDLDSYEAVRTDFDRFLVLPGHEIDAVDRVVERHSGYLVVVKKQPEDKRMAREADERSE